MVSMWKNMSNSQVWKVWPDWDPLHGLFFESGLISNEPLHDTLLEFLSGKELQKKVIVSAVDASSGDYKAFLLNELEDDEKRVSAVMGSGAFPFVFPPRHIHAKSLGADQAENYTLIDGAAAWNSNVMSGIQHCFNMTGIESYEQVELDVMLLIPESFDSWIWD